MTADRRAALVERVADAFAKAWDDHGRVVDGAAAAIDLIRAEVLEEAAAEVERIMYLDGHPIAAAIRALKGGT